MRILLTLCFIISYTAIFSQTCNYTMMGTLIDTHDKSALAGATIILVETNKAVISNFDGNFTLTDLCKGEYSLQISHPECTTKIFKIEVSGNFKKTFSLEHHIESLNEITLKGRVYTTKTETLLENVVKPEDLVRFSGNSIGDALNTLSGVSSLNTGNTIIKPIINGLHSSRVTIMNNGVRMQDQEWGAEHAPNIDINTVSYLSVIKGASALQYTGDAIGGVVVAEPTRAPIKDTLFGKSIFTFATNGRGGSNTTTVVKSFENGWYGQALGTLKRFGDYEAPDYILSNTGNFERSILTRIGLNKINQGFEAQYSYFKNDIGILRASHLGGAEDQFTAIGSNTPLIVRPFTHQINAPKQEVTHQIVKISGYKDIEGLGRVNLQYDYQNNKRFEFDIRRGDDKDKPSVDLTLNTHQISADVKTNLSETIKLKYGGMFNYQENIANPDTGVRRLIPDYEQYKIGAFSILDWDVTENLLLEAGLRYDYTFMDVFKFYRTSFWESRNYDQLFPEIVVEQFGNQILTNPQLEFNNFSATLGGAYQLKNNYTAFLNFSLASRAPNASELFSEGLHHSASRIELGDLQFNSEISKKIAFTLQKKGTLGFTVNPYIQWIDNFIIIEPTSVEQTIRGNFQVWEYRQTPTLMYGIDFNFNASLYQNLKWDSNFSMVKAYEQNVNLPLIDMPPANINNTLSYNYKKLSVALQNEIVFAQNEFPNNNFEIFLPETESFVEVDVSTPPPTYTIWNMRLAYPIKLSKKTNLNIQLQVTNLLDVSYRNYLNRLRFYADDLGRNIILNTNINF